MGFIVGKEYELYDISEAITPQTIRHKVADNVEFVLRREKVLPRGYSVVIPAGGDDYEMGDEELRYKGNFEIFAPDHDTIVAYGFVQGYGLGDVLEEIDATITEVTGDRPKPRAKKSSTKRKSGKRSSSTPTSMRGMR